MNSRKNNDTQSVQERDIRESRSERFNVPVRHRPIWRIVLDQFVGSPMRLHRYRDLSRRIAEDALYTKDCGERR